MFSNKNPAVVAEWSLLFNHETSLKGPEFEYCLGLLYAILVIIVVDCVMELWFTQVSREIGYETPMSMSRQAAWINIMEPGHTESPLKN